SLPPLVQKKPPTLDVKYTALTMKIAIASAAGRVNSPIANKQPAPISVNPTSVPQNMPELYQNRSKSCALARNPLTPHQPNSFWHPCGMRIPPAVTRRIGAAQQLSLA